MFDKKYEDRLTIWREFRNELETSADPLQDTIDFYNQAPYCLRQKKVSNILPTLC